MKKCAILGASGHGKVVADIAELNGYHSVDFFDDRWPGLQAVEHWAVAGNVQELLEVLGQYDAVVVAIGDNEIRLNKQVLLRAAGAPLTVLIHPAATVSRHASIEEGSVVMANAVVNPFASIGKACILNTGSTIDHDCRLSDGVHISPGANLAGGVSVGALSWVGIGAQIKQLISIGEKVVVGAGATVIHNVPDNQTVMGTPAKQRPE